MIENNKNNQREFRIIVLSADYVLNTRLQKKLQRFDFVVIGFYDFMDAVEWEAENVAIPKIYLIDAINPTPGWKRILSCFHSKELSVNSILLVDRNNTLNLHEIKQYGVNDLYIYDDGYLDQLVDMLKNCMSGISSKGSVGFSLKPPVVPHDKTQNKPAEEASSVGRSIKNASALLASLSNDITEPLTTLITMARDLEKTKLTHEQNNLLKSIIAAAGNLRNSIDNAMDYAGMEVVKPEVVYHNFHLTVLLEELVALIKPQADVKQITLQLTIAESLPDYVFGDKTKIQQILAHLFGHLIKSLDNISIELSVQAVTEGTLDSMLAFVFKTDFVSEAGKENHAAKALPANDIHGNNENMGLGLRIAKTLVEVMGGELVMEKQPDLSLRMSFNIPLMESSASIVADNPPANYQEHKKPLRVLLAEDDVISQMYMAGFLRMQGWEVDTAYNGIAVMELFAPGKYDLIVMDGQMPAMDGFETARKIRQLESKNTLTPILAISGFANPGDKQKFLNAGMDEYLPKPINEDELLRVIDLLVK